MTPGGLLLLTAALAGFSPFEREEENVRAGNARLREGDPAGALERYDAAERAVGPRPEIDFDRGHAALRAGRLAEAEALFRRAARAAPPALASRALQNVGNALAAAGDREGAARAFGDALLADPSNEDARWDLEVLLRERERRYPPPPQAASPGSRQATPQGGPGPQAPPPAARQPDRGGAPAAPDRTSAAGEPTDGEARAGAAAEAARGGAPRALSRQDAEALLDALRAGERNMPLFGRERKQPRRRDGAKDW